MNNLGSFGFIPNRKAELPTCSAPEVAQLRADYDLASKSGGGDTKDSLVRLIWALVHSDQKKSNRQGVAFAQNLAQLADKPEELQQLKYLIAVGEYNLGNKLAARKTLQATLKQWPTFRQASGLLAAIEEEMTSEAVVVGGALAAVGGLAAVLVGALVAGRR